MLDWLSIHVYVTQSDPELFADFVRIQKNSASAIPTLTSNRSNQGMEMEMRVRPTSSSLSEALAIPNFAQTKYASCVRVRVCSESFSLVHRRPLLFGLYVVLLATP